MGRKREFSKDMTFEEMRKAFGSVALQQALRSLGLTYEAIGARMGVSKRTAWNNCNGIQGCIPWSERSNKEQLVEVAEFIINNF